MKGIPTQTLIKALRVCASNISSCTDCPIYNWPVEEGKSTCHDYIMRLAAGRLELAMQRGDFNEKQKENKKQGKAGGDDSGIADNACGMVFEGNIRVTDEGTN